MYTSTLLSVALVATLAAAAPLELGYDVQPGEGDAHAATLTKAKDDANAQINNMRATLANPDDPVNAQRIRDAFGPNAKIDEISKTVEKLHTGTLQVASADPSVADAEKQRPALAKVSLNMNSDGTFNSMGSAKIGSRFHKSTFSDKQRAGTLIHEATHQLARTGDDVITQGMGKDIIVPAGVRPAGAAAHGINKEGGYARTDTLQINSAADLSDEYKALRDASPNMHQNADSYRVFGALCSRSLFKRALSQENPVEYYLAKRQQCSLPPDYFKKKAEAKAAAAKGTTPTTGSAPGKTDAKAKGGLKGAAAKVAKGLKATNAMKSSKGAKGSRTALAKGSRAGKASKGARAAKGGKAGKAVRGAKVAKGSRGLAKGTRGAKAGKVTRGAKGLKAVKGQRSAKAGKGAKGAKSARLSKATRAGKAGKGSKALKGAKATRGAKGAKGAKTLKAVKGSRAAKAGKGAKAAKGTKPLRSPKGAKAGKVTKAVRGGKASKAGKTGKAAKALKVAKNGRAGRAAQGAKSVKGAKVGKAAKATGTRKAGTKATKSPTTKAGTKSASRKITKAAPQVAKAATQAKLSSPKKTGKKTRRDLESIFDELD